MLCIGYKLLLVYTRYFLKKFSLKDQSLRGLKFKCLKFMYLKVKSGWKEIKQMMSVGWEEGTEAVLSLPYLAAAPCILNSP